METDRSTDEELVTAKTLQVLPPGTAYKMVKAKLIPYFLVGVKKRYPIQTF